MLPASGIMVCDTENRPETRNTHRMLPRNDPDRINIAFDDHRLMANAGLIPPVTLAHHLGLGELVDDHADLRDAAGRVNPGDKLLTLVASALAGGDCIDDADALRAGSTESVLGCVVKVLSTLGTFFGADPSDDPLGTDLDATVCETYELAKQGAQRHNYAG